jgi:hypothetical protein
MGPHSCTFKHAHLISQIIQHNLSLIDHALVTPEHLRPFPKAGARKNTGKSRDQKTRILSDTPVKIALREGRKHAAKCTKKSKSKQALESNLHQRCK